MGGAATACLWLVHPLQTQAVTYIYQRIEIMGTTAIFAAVACFLLGETSRHRTAWRGLSVCSCLLGSFCKETVIAAPVLVLLCEWIVLRTKPQDLVTKRLPLCAGLFACWPLVVAIVRLQADRYPESQGLGYGPLAYLANQPAVIVWYLRLAVWPTKLCFDYGRPKDALPFLRNAIELQPRYPLAYATLGQVFEMLGEKEQAVNAYARAAELDPADAAVMSRLQVLKAATTGTPTAE
jgi:hypothetical protein